MFQSKKLIVLIITLSMLLFDTIPVKAEATRNFSDLHDNWAKKAIMHAVENGLLYGSGNKIMPGSELKRSEMAAILTRAFGATVKADITNFSDISPDRWYADDMAKAIKMGAFYNTEGKMHPEKSLTREEAFTVLANVLRLGTTDFSALDKFSDKSEVSPWALLQLSALAECGYINGSGGKLNPRSTITRAEMAQVMYNIFKRYIKEPGTYTSVPEGSIMINVSGVTLKDVTVKGDLVIGDGVGTGNCTLDTVKIKGRLIIRGGGEHTTVANHITVEGQENSVNLLSDADGRLGQIIVTNSAGTVVLNTPSQSIGTSAPPAPVFVPTAQISSFYQSLSNQPTAPPVPTVPTAPTAPVPAVPAVPTVPTAPPAPPVPLPSNLTNSAAVVICNPNNNTRLLAADSNIPNAVCEPGSIFSGDTTNLVVCGSSPATAAPPQSLQPNVQIIGNTQNTYVFSPSQVALGGGAFQNFTVGNGAQNTILNVGGANLGQLNIQSPGTQVNVNSGTISQLNIGSSAQNTSVTVQRGAAVQTVSADAQTTLAGPGTVLSVQANADNVRVSTTGTIVTAGQGVTGVMAGGATVAPGESITVNAPTSANSSAQSGTSGSTGSSGNHSGGTPPVLSSNADLKSLSITNGVLAPQFSRYITSYTLCVPSDVTSVSVTAEVYEHTETIKINGIAAQNNVASDPIEVYDGQNSVVVSVYAENGNQKDYVITLTKAPVLSSNADLKSLSVTGGVLTPQFSRDNTSYTLCVPSDVTSVSVTAEVYEHAETIKINEIAVQNNVASDPIELSTGQNSVVVTVYAENGNQKDYVITLTKAPKPESAETEYNGIRIQMDGNLTGFEGDPNAFEIYLEFSGGALIHPSRVSIDDNQVFLELSNPIPPGTDGVTISYHKTGVNDLTNGALVSDFEEFPVTLTEAS